MLSPPLAQGTALWKLLPQRPPMVFIDALLEANATEASSRFRVGPTTLFVNQQQLQAPGLLENMAQTAAAQQGWLAQQMHQPIAIGLIARIKKSTIHQLPLVGTTLITHVHTTAQWEGRCRLEGRVFGAQQLLAEGTFWLVQPTAS